MESQEKESRAAASVSAGAAVEGQGPGRRRRGGGGELVRVPGVRPPRRPAGAGARRLRARPAPPRRPSARSAPRAERSSPGASPESRTPVADGPTAMARGSVRFRPATAYCPGATLRKGDHDPRDLGFHAPQAFLAAGVGRCAAWRTVLAAALVLVAVLAIALCVPWSAGDVQESTPGRTPDSVARRRLREPCRRRSGRPSSASADRRSGKSRSAVAGTWLAAVPPATYSSPVIHPAEAMIRDSVIDWQELSACTSRPTGSTKAAGQRSWRRLRAQKHRLLGQLERMLRARDRIATSSFLESLPRLAPARRLRHRLPTGQRAAGSAPID